VVRDGTRLAAQAVVIGIPAGVAAAGALGSILFGVTATDRVTLIGVSVGMVTLSMLVSWWPARRSTRVDLAPVLRGR
jgi:ABC-type lipoprotein release transport system permease subunit